MRRVVLVGLAVLAIAAPASAASRVPHPVLLGILGNAGRFHGQTGQDSAVRHVIVGWGQGQTWGSRFPVLLRRMGRVPMLGLSTGNGHGGERITPEQIARGKGDSYLVTLNRGIAAFGREVYVRPFGEMNGYWNPYSAYTQSGQVKP
ncbi:MAG: hypothetical protein ACRDLK_03865, partial [Gaiellaceae bacterium]